MIVLLIHKFLKPSNHTVVGISTSQNQKGIELAKHLHDFHVPFFYGEKGHTNQVLFCFILFIYQ